MRCSNYVSCVRVHRCVVCVLCVVCVCVLCLFFFLMIRRPPRSTLDRSSAASDVYKRQGLVLQDPEAQAIFQRLGDNVAFGPENMNVPRKEIWDLVNKSLEEVGLELSLIHISEPMRPY